MDSITLSDYAKGQASARDCKERHVVECFYAFNAPKHQTPEYKRGYVEEMMDVGPAPV